MELYLDSANLKEIEEGFKLGFLNGLTTTPTFMQREGITDVDGTIVKLSKIVPVLQIEALGDTAEEILKSLTENNMTALGTDQFIHDTRLMTVKVKDAINGVNPVVQESSSLQDAIVKMTEYGFGCITIVKKDGSIKGVFTDGDLRRQLTKDGRNILNHKMSDFKYNTPISIDGDALLNDAAALFKKTNVDTVLVTGKNKPVGMLDIQDLKND